MLNHEIKSVDAMLRMFTAMQKALRNISIDIQKLQENECLEDDYEWD